jgi:hypothetical protein
MSLSTIFQLYHRGSQKVDGEFLEVGGDWTCHRHVPEHHRRVTPSRWAGGLGGPPPETLEILDGRRCNLGIYLRKMKLLIGLKNAGFLG